MYPITKPSLTKQIILHSLLWVVISLLIGLPIYLKQQFSFFWFGLEWLSYVFLFYCNYLFLVPTYLLKNQYLKYFTIILFGIVVLTFIRIHFMLDPFKLPFPKHDVIVNGQPIKIALKPPHDSPFLGIAFSFSYVFIVLISTIIKTLYEFNQNFQTKILAETERKTAELNYLRKQTNPHFLFNSLNSIYSLAVKKSELVPDAIVTLSELMRYMLYETNQRVVPLEKEINYIVNYVELQKLRIQDAENIRINIIGDIRNHMIEPLLLISFIENAFKYGTDYKGKTYVRLKIQIMDSNLDFYCENTISRKTEDPINSGIGVKNIQSRLAILYPKSHSLDIRDENGLYKVHLTLNLEENNPLL
ncbi:MAG: hypothetical protein RL607_1959 [Bacteroidota bacterium]|jgi:sensor histidine kinase YesM